MVGGVDSAWLSLGRVWAGVLRDFGALKLLNVLSTREMREGWIFPFDNFGVFGGFAPLEVEVAAGEAERLRFEDTGIDLAGDMGEADDPGADEETEISPFTDGIEGRATSDSEFEEFPGDEDMERFRWSAANGLVWAGAGAKADEADDDEVDSDDMDDERLYSNGADRTDWACKGAEEEAEEEEEEEEEDDAEELEEVELLERLRLTILGGCTCSSVALEVDDFAEKTGFLGGMGLMPFPRGAFGGFVEETPFEVSSSSPLPLLLSLLLSWLCSFATARFLFDFEIEVGFFALL